MVTCYEIIFFSTQISVVNLWYLEWGVYWHGMGDGGIYRWTRESRLWGCAKVHAAPQPYFLIAYFDQLPMLTLARFKSQIGSLSNEAVLLYFFFDVRNGWGSTWAVVS